MAILVDAYNVLHTVGVLPPDIAGIDVPALASLIRESRFRQQHTILVCDGKPAPDQTPRRAGNISVRYSGPSLTADEIIIARIRKSFVPKSLLIVSSDRAILREARKRRCRTLTAQEFLAHLADDHEAKSVGRKKDASREATAAPAKPVGRRRLAKPPKETVLPLDLVQEAEAMLRQGLPDIEQPPPPATRPATESGPPPDDQNASQPAGTPQATDTESPPKPVFPSDLIAQALRLAKPPDPPGSTETAQEDPTDHASDSPEQPETNRHSADDTPPPPAAIPSDIIREAEELWREDRSKRQPPGNRRAAPADD